LAATEFNSYKSDLKFLEYSALGLPGVYSNSAAYYDTIYCTGGALLAEEDPETWVEQVGRLAFQVEMGRELVDKASEYVRNERTLRQEGADAVDILVQALRAG
jgi:hypothetical protein